jgi:hypothetical protein
MSQNAAHLVGNLIPQVPVRQSVLSPRVPALAGRAAKLDSAVLQLGSRRVSSRHLLDRPGSLPTKGMAAPSR